jgi:hypothetical protein
MALPGTAKPVAVVHATSPRTRIAWSESVDEANPTPLISVVSYGFYV